MSVRYEWGWDVDQLELDGTAIGTLSASVNDGSSSGVAEVASGTYCHTDLTSVMGTGEYDDWATAWKTEINTVWGSGAIVTYSTSAHAYTIGKASGTTTFDFTTATLGNSSGKMLAALMGFNYLHANATGGSASDPYNISLGGSSQHTSNCRPYFLILPTISGRSNVSDEYEPDGAVSESEADDGTTYHVSKDGVSIYSDWQQAAETDTPPSTHSDDGMAVFKRSATAEVPWSYQHAWEHARSGGSLPFLVVDSGTSESAVHQLRADGLSFRPVRFAAQDYSLWSVPFRSRLLGRL